MDEQSKLLSDRDEWLKYRLSGIGASDSPIVLWLSKFMSPFELFEIKTGRRQSENKSNFAIDEGNRLEPIARNKFAVSWNWTGNFDETFAPKNVEMEGARHLRASLDGISDDGQTIIEIKYQGESAHNEVSRGVIDPAYRCQIQHQLMVTNAARAYLVSINKHEEINWTEIKPDRIYQTELFQRLEEFWGHVKANKWPGEGADFERDLDEWHAAGVEIKRLEARRKQITDAIFAEAVDVCGPYRVQTITRKGPIRYDAIPELDGVDLEVYRSVDVVFKQIKKV